MRYALALIIVKQEDFMSNNSLSSKARTSVRIILLNHSNEILLLKADDPTTTTLSGHYNGPFWFCLGGKIEEGESAEQAALREIQEESGLERNAIKLGAIVWWGEFDLILSGILTRQKQVFMLAHTNDCNVSLNNLTNEEKNVIVDIKWFSLNDVKNSKEIIYPLDLAQYLEPILRGKIPKQPLEIDLGKNP